MTQRFTVDDLTVDEHGRLSRQLKMNPAMALADPSSQVAGQALAGLAFMRDRRDDPTVQLAGYQQRTIRELQETLGLLEPDLTAHRLAALLQRVTGEDWPEFLEELDPRDPNELSTVDQRAVVWVLTGVDPGDDQDEQEPETSPADVAQDAIDQVSGENGMDPSARPASPSSA